MIALLVIGAYVAGMLTAVWAIWVIRTRKP